MTIAIGAFFAIVSHKYSLSYIALKLINSDIARIRKKKNYEYNDKIFDIVQLSLIFGMGLYFILFEQIFGIFIAILVLLAMALFDKIIKFKKNKVASFITPFISTLFLVTALRVIADDGGVAEAGGFKNWIGSPGSGQAILIGLPPAIGSAIGGIMGIITGSNSLTDFIDSINLEGVTDSVEQNQLDVEQIQHPEGVVELVFPNGTRQLKFPDGSVKETWPDGTITGTTSGGTTFIHKTNGEIEIKDPNGDVITEYPDGRIVAKTNDGFEITDNPDGSQEIYDPEYNETVIHNTGGTRTFIDDDGKNTLVDKNDNIIEITTKNGYKGIKKDDGTVEITNINHEGKIIIDQDDNIKGTIIEEDGTKIDFSGEGSEINITTNDGLELHVDENNVMTGDLGNGNKLIREVGSGKTNIEMENGSTLIYHDDGKISGKDAESGYDFEIIDGESIEMKDGKGNYTKQNADGSFEIETEDGWSDHGNSDGERHLKAPNSNNMTIKEDGSVIVKYNDGSIGKINTDKSVELRRSDGTIERSVENQVTIEKSDGTVEKLSMEEYTKNINNAMER